MTKVYLLVEHPAWNAKNHADALIARAWRGWDVEVAVWNDREHEWRFDDADAIVNLGSNSQERLWREALERRPAAAVAVRYNTCYPRYEDKFVRLLRNSHAVIVESRLCLDRCQHFGGVHLVPTGVDLGVFRANGPPVGRPDRVLWAAGVVGQSPERAEVKRYALAVQIAAMLEKYGVEMELLAVDPLNGPIRSREEMVDWYNSGRVYVVTSEIEGVPNVALEAAACGCAIVSTPVGQMPELVRNGVNGYLVEEPTVETFCEAIMLARKNYLWWTAGIRHSVDSFGWNRRVHGFFKFLEELIGERRKIVDSG